ncbi:hypothetical protein C8J56DRAFT_1710 [Mycena floridula]|nr:hypothetical protein C8J56DRAFT_1710 [Mycena floridula]
MPIDIVVNIFERLHPIDLLHLTKGNKSLHEWITGPAFVSAWTNAYSQYPVIPRTPEGVSVYRWTYLLYDSAGTCFKCESKEVVMVDFVLRARLCTNCLMSTTEEMGPDFFPTGTEIDPNIIRSGTPAAKTYRLIGRSITQDGTRNNSERGRSRGPSQGMNWGRASRPIISRIRQEIDRLREGKLSLDEYHNALLWRIFKSNKLECPYFVRNLPCGLQKSLSSLACRKYCVLFTQET